MKNFSNRKRKTYSFIVLFLLINLVLINSINIERTKANPLSMATLLHGVFLPINVTHGIEMQNAEVLFNIDAYKCNRTAFIDYKGNYTFYNTNITQTLLVAAPFASNINGLGQQFTVLVDKVQTNFTMMEFFYENTENYGYYFPEYPSVGAILCNITFQTNMTKNVYYEYESQKTSISQDSVHIDYIVGTANSWYNSSNINEKVEFKVKGFQPKGYSENCSVTKITDGRSYLWSWENEQIEVYRVGIFYRNRRMNYGTKLILIIVLPSVCIPLIIAYAIFRLVRKSKKSKVKRKS